MRISKLVQLGVTLVELMIVVALVGIIAAIAYPSYLSHMTKTRNAEAQIMLLEIMQAQRKYFTDNNGYSNSLVAELGYTESASVENAVDTEHGHYVISATNCVGDPVIPLTECVLLTATPNIAAAPTLTYNSRNQKDSTPPGAW